MSVCGVGISVTALSEGACKWSLRVVRLNYCKRINSDCLLQLARSCQRSLLHVLPA